MADGNVFVAAGSLTGLDYHNLSNNNPTYEILDRDGISNGQSIMMDILVDNQPYWMYPFIHLMPDGLLFIFADTASELFNVSANRTAREMPGMPGMHRTYPNTGGSVMLPLSGHNNYRPEIMICGGGEKQALDSPCDATCGRIRPLEESPTWSMTKVMPQPRGMVEAVNLLNGTVLWINGVQRGAQGFGIASHPSLDALVYDPAADEWKTSGSTNIARLYHSVALMLLDGTILIAGSNPNEMPLLIDEVDSSDPLRAFPTEYRIEIWTPPYLLGAKASMRPTNVLLSTKELEVGGSFWLSFQPARKAPESLQIVLYAGGFVTHSVHMGQVMLYLPYDSQCSSDAEYMAVNVQMPGTDIHLAPGPYVIYIVVDGVPSIGQFVTLKG